MSTAAMAPGKSVAVTVIGVITMLWGGLCAAVGSHFIFLAIAMMERPASAEHGARSLFAGLQTMIGAAFLLQSVAGILAGLGVLWRKPWGRIATFILAGLAILWGLFFLVGIFEKADFEGSATYIALGAPHLLYSILALVILMPRAAEFSQPATLIRG